MIESETSETGVGAGLTTRREAVRGKRTLSSVNTRIIVVILLSILPLAASASLLAWHDYREQVDLSARRVDAALSDYLAAEGADLESALGSVDVLAGTLGAAPASACTHILSLALSLGTGRFDDLTVRGPDGHLVCSSSACPLIDLPVGMGSFGEISRRADGALVLPVRRRLRDGSGSVLQADLRLRRPASRATPVEAWLIDRSGRVWPLTASTAMPSLPPLGSLGRAVFSGRGDGTQGIFAVGRLAGDNVVVIGGRATREEARAASLLIERMAAIASILAFGLALVTVGAHVTVAAPIQALTRRVTHWRNAGTFDEGHMKFVPAEMAELIDAFALATRSLASREQELERARLEQELAFKEIHHRVKNNLQIIASLLNLQGNRIRLPEAKAEFQSARDRVRALATLHRHLYADAGLHTIAMRGFLLELCGQLFQAIGEREGHRIRLDVEAPELQMSSDQAVPVALIVTEAVSNAVKYAFPGARSGTVSVRLCTLAGGRISLTIEDDGVGIPAGQAETETGVRDGLGIQLISGFAKQLGASLTVSQGDGTRYHLELLLRHADAERAGTERA